MLENILLSAAYYETFSKFANSLNKKMSFSEEEKDVYAREVVTKFFHSARAAHVSEDDITALAEDLYDNVLSELDNCNDVVSTIGIEPT